MKEIRVQYLHVSTDLLPKEVCARDFNDLNYGLIFEIMDSLRNFLNRS